MIFHSVFVSPRICGGLFLFAFVALLSITCPQALGAGISDFETPITTETIDVGPQVSSFAGDTRGFWFTAPTNFRITGLGVPTDQSSDNFDVSVIRLNTAPPTFNANTSDFDTLHISRNVAGDETFRVPVSIDVGSGDIIGILGSRGGNSINSYGAEGFATSILGNAVTLDRLLMQSDLRTTDPVTVGVSTEDFFIGRVFVDVQAIPEPSALALLSMGVAAVFSRRRR